MPYANVRGRAILRRYTPSRIPHNKAENENLRFPGLLFLPYRQHSHHSAQNLAVNQESSFGLRNKYDSPDEPTISLFYSSYLAHTQPSMLRVSHWHRINRTHRITACNRDCLPTYTRNRYRTTIRNSCWR